MALKSMPHASENVWKFCKPFFTNQSTNFDDKIMLIENEKVVSQNEEIAIFSILTSITLLKD